MRFKHILLLVLISLLLILVIFVNHKMKSVHDPLQDECTEDVSLLIIKNFLDEPKEMLTDRTIYFLETHNITEHQLTARQACAIESAAFTNPNSSVYVLFLTPCNHVDVKNCLRFQKLLLYKNIHLRLIHMADIIKDTPAEAIEMLENIQNSKWQVLHASDTLRYAILHKFSGVYFDLDVIVRRPIADIAPNFVCLEGTSSVNNAIIRLSGDESAKSIGDMLLKGVVSKFNGGQWAIGPRLLTKVVKQFCKIKDFKRSIECNGLKILPIEKCYAIQGHECMHFFIESKTNNILRRVNNSYFVHLWNYQSDRGVIDTTKYVAINFLAAEFCPRVYESNEYI